jgi:translocation protein SEC63
VKFHKALIQIALGFNYFEPIRAAMEISQCLFQAVPIGGPPLSQLPGVTTSLARKLEAREKKPVRTIQDLRSLDEKEQRSALESLDDKAYAQAINVAKNIPILIVSSTHFKGFLALNLS